MQLVSNFLKTRFFIFVCLATLAALGSTQTWANGFLISHPNLSLTLSAAKDVFVGDKQFAGEIKIIPVDNLASQNDFLERVLTLRKVQYESNWAKKSFREGIPPPLSKFNDSETVDFVRSTPGAVGYVKNQPPSGVTIVDKY